jgi:hypothetical protein
MLKEVTPEALAIFPLPRGSEGGGDRKADGGVERDLEGEISGGEEV